MIYRSMQECVEDLASHGQLVKIQDSVSPHLVMAAVQRRVYRAGGPAILYEKVEGTPFPAVSNLFGTIERSRFIFRSRLELVKKAVAIKGNPEVVFKRPWRYWRVPFAALAALPKRVQDAPVFARETQISKLPHITSWPRDGGAFVTLPQVYSEDPDRPGPLHANLGMYRIQLSGNDYQRNEQIGMHYQIHRGIGVHHTKARDDGTRLQVAIFIGGPPAHTLAAVMPLPEGLSELTFAGMLSGRRFRYSHWQSHTLSADADFCILGYIDPTKTLPEGPFGDHLGYYSLIHEFPYLKVEKVFHRADAIWPFTVVGRPPQEDTSFGKLIHEITAGAVTSELPGVKALHAVDAAGVHPLLFALGSERYTPYQQQKAPQELLTLSNAILGFGQCSLAKYLFITAEEPGETVDIEDEGTFLQHCLARIDWRRDLHFQTNTTIDTLDYSGTGLNQGSKLVIAAYGKPMRELTTAVPGEIQWPDQWKYPQWVMPGVIAIQMQPFEDYRSEYKRVTAQCEYLGGSLDKIALIILCDDSAQCAASLENFLWIAFTRSNPSHDTYGVHAEYKFKHWGCQGPFVIDARIKPHHAPILEEDDQAESKAEQVLSRYPQLLG